MILHPVTTQLQFLLISVAGWMSRHQQTVIEYLQEENRILLEQLGGKPKRFTDAQRIRLARKAKLVGRRRLGKLATLVTPDTLRWFRVLVAKKWTFPRTNPLGRLSAAAMNSAECSTITTAKPRELPFSMVSRVFWKPLNHRSGGWKKVTFKSGTSSYNCCGMCQRKCRPVVQWCFRARLVAWPLGWRRGHCRSEE